MTFLISNWRLKLLALGLALGLLGAVAFSENPVSVTSVPAVVDYDNKDPSLVVVNPTLRTTVSVFGVSSAVDPLKATFPNGVRFKVDLRGVTQPVAQRTFYATPKTLPAGVSWNGDQVPIAVGIDIADTKSYDIEVRTPFVAPGFKVLGPLDAQGKPITYAECGNSGQACQVKVTAPKSLLANLKAYVLIGDQQNPITGTNVDSPTQPVRFEENGRPVDLSKFNSFPTPAVDPSIVNVHVTLQQSQTTRQAAIKVNVTGRPACGYGITSIGFTPDAFVTITGAADKVAKIDSITLGQAIDVTNATASLRSQQAVPTDGFTATPAQVTVVVSISRQIDCAAPTPTPTPKASP
ncbi:MAG TPA: CdaR family protein [Candidatus Dormibacteraeota bacterium]|jgi:YbbR domain-containing protein